MVLGMKDIEGFFADERGQDLVEYALVAALVGLGAVASIKTLSTKIGAGFTSIGTTLTTNV
jgi:pilus assembly protein Flp/PilA